MILNTFKKQKKKSPDGFRYRGRKGSRLENLTDTIFGFSITLLIVANEVPKTYLELQTSMYSFIGFICSSMLLLGIWNNHRSFFLHYGLQDRFTRTLNFLFLFVLLFYIYPLKYLFSYVGTSLYALIKMNFGDTSKGLQLATEQLTMAEMNLEQWTDIIIRFGLGLLCIYTIYILFHINALKKKKLLQLNKREVFITNTFIQSYIILSIIASLSIGSVLIFGGAIVLYAGLFYLLIPFAIPIHRRFRKKRLTSKVWKKNKLKEPSLTKEDVLSEQNETTLDIEKDSVLSEKENSKNL